MSTLGSFFTLQWVCTGGEGVSACDAVAPHTDRGCGRRYIASFLPEDFEAIRMGVVVVGDIGSMKVHRFEVALERTPNDHEMSRLLDLCGEGTPGDLAIETGPSSAELKASWRAPSLGEAIGEVLRILDHLRIGYVKVIRDDLTQSYEDSISEAANRISAEGDLEEGLKRILEGR